MNKNRTARQLGICPWELIPGPRNLITDVPGISVGHTTLDDGAIKTGVTAILPHQENTFMEKLPAASHVINGFGKSMGLIQVNEMGTLETPLILTNTMSIGQAADGLLRYMLDQNPDIDLAKGTINPLVFECNDGRLNDIRGMHVRNEHIFHAIANAESDFAQGGVGAGTGMCAYELKGGIGSSSRKIALGHNSYTLGALVLTNMGKTRDLIIAGARVGKEIEDKHPVKEEHVPDGSIIIVLATDIPLSQRQLGRISRRALAGLSLTGSKIDSGSGEIVVAFSTATRIAHRSEDDIFQVPQIHEARIDAVFRAVVEAVEEAVLNSMFTASTTTGNSGNRVLGLTECLDKQLLQKILAQ